MKKAIYLVELLALGALTLGACGSSSKKGGSSGETSGSGQSSGQSGQSSQGSSSSKPIAEITYRSWDYGTEGQDNEERQLIRLFEQKENVKVNIVENPGTGNGYWDGIKASIVNGIDLADVMMVPNLDWPLAANYLLNIKQYADADQEFGKVPSSIRDACTFKSGIYAVPARMNLQGYFMNSTLVEGTLGIRTSNINVNSGYDVIENIVNEAAKKQDVVGLDTAAHFIDTMASVLDDTGTMGYFTWDGSEYHLDSEAFITGVQKARAMYESKKTLDAYNEEEKTALGLDLEIEAKVDAWNKGKLALRYGYTYEIPDMLDKNTLNQKIKFIGNPGGKISIVGDYYGIYKETKHPEIAYKFAKWMSFGLDGFKKRMELYEPKGSVNSLPLTDDQDLIDEYFDKFGSSSELTGLEAAYRYIQTKSMVEGVKVVPGFLQARQNKKTGLNVQVGDAVLENIKMFDLLNNCIIGGLEIANYTSGAINIDTIADKTYSDWMSLYGDQYE